MSPFNRDTPLADPGALGARAPLAPNVFFFQNYAAFRHIERKTPYFEQIVGLRAPLGSKIYWAPMTKILDPPCTPVLQASTAPGVGHPGRFHIKSGWPRPKAQPAPLSRHVKVAGGGGRSLGAVQAFDTGEPCHSDHPILP